MQDSYVFRAVLATAVALFTVADLASAREVSYLARPGVLAKAFPRPERPVASIVSPSRSVEAMRDVYKEAHQLTQLMGLKPGMTLADIGAGDGYHTARLAPLLGPSGRLIAQDVSTDYLATLAKRIKSSKLDNVTVALGEPHDPRLPPASLDAAILVHMYHEIAEPYAFLYNLAPAMKPGAPVGIVDHAKPILEHGTPLPVLRCELAAVGYREIAVHMLRGDAGYLAIFVAPKAADRPRPAAIKPCASK